MSLNKVSVVIPGWLNTDIIGVGVERLVGKGQYARGSELKIGPGGKSRNIAEMMAVQIGGEKIAMLGRTVKDPLGLWKYPVDALNLVGVDTSYIEFSEYSKAKQFPGVALIPVDRDGNNQIYVLPGVSGDYSPADLLQQESVFKSASTNNGILAMTLEISMDTALAAIKLGLKHGLKIIIDPGGITSKYEVSKILEQPMYLLKPNEHEAEILSGVRVNDFTSAKAAADKIKTKGVKNILITHGVHGAYLFSDNLETHIKPPKISATIKVRDETGCGDQTMATLCSELSRGRSLEVAAELAVKSGTLQFYKSGIQPIKLSELENSNG